MNELFALELLGFENFTDFEMSANGELSWLTDIAIPTEQEMQDAWDEWETSTGPLNFARDKDLAMRRIDSIAERKRSEYLTSGSGQAMVYEQKYTEAQLFLANGGDVASYPFIASESVARGISPTDFATLIVQKRNEWAQVGAQIEALRYTAKEDVNAAVDSAAVKSILVGLETSLAAL